ncbi:MAG TPA: RsmE family RNA methyltransferase [Herpetosiphonaceae bacterium]
MKNTYRFFVAPEAIGDGSALIEDRDLLRQWSSVLRLRPGSQVALLDGSGLEHTVELLELGKNAASCRILASAPSRGEPAARVELYVALTRGERFEWVLQKGTELGASAFVPLLCERSQAGEAKAERWGRIIREAAEQSGRGRLPELRAPLRFAAALAAAPAGILLAEHSSAVSFKAALDPDGGGCAIWSGPEGGWSDGELAAASAAGLALATLGPRILRAETAPVAALAAAMFAMGEWERGG